VALPISERAGIKQYIRYYNRYRIHRLPLKNYELIRASPGFVRARRRKGLTQQVRRDREAMLQICHDLELPLLLAAQAKLSP
jgi:hypothetical protein